jgi:hypothetical protein
MVRTCSARDRPETGRETFEAGWIRLHARPGSTLPACWQDGFAAPAPSASASRRAARRVRLAGRFHRPALPARPRRRARRGTCSASAEHRIRGALAQRPRGHRVPDPVRAKDAPPTTSRSRTRRRRCSRRIFLTWRRGCTRAAAMTGQYLHLRCTHDDRHARGGGLSHGAVHPARPAPAGSAPAARSSGCSTQTAGAGPQSGIVLVHPHDHPAQLPADRAYYFTVQRPGRPGPAHWSPIFAAERDAAIARPRPARRPGIRRRPRSAARRRTDGTAAAISRLPTPWRRHDAGRRRLRVAHRRHRQPRPWAGPALPRPGRCRGRGHVAYDVPDRRSPTAHRPPPSTA